MLKQKIIYEELCSNIKVRAAYIKPISMAPSRREGGE